MMKTSLFLLSLCAALHAAEYHFDFSNGKNQQLYDEHAGFGFTSLEKESKVKLFTVKVAEGNYDVTIKFGDAKQATNTTVKAESRRLMLEAVQTAAGKYETRTFTVNVRKPEIQGGGMTRLNGRELGPPAVPNWDEFLNLELNGENPGVVSLDIVPAKSAVTLFIAGDSTVTDQAKEPYAGWGQMLPRFFSSGVAVSNHAESGLALFSFAGQKRLDKVLSMMKKGDYLFIQFGHNDQKNKKPGAGPFTTYKADLKKYVDATRAKGGIPILVSSMERRHFQGEKIKPSLADFAEAVRQVGQEEKVLVIDLNQMSIQFYEALGAKLSTKALVYYPANTFPNQEKALSDDTHHSDYGAYELAKCVVEGIKAQVPDLAKHLVPDSKKFNPAHPDAPEDFRVPLSPFTGKSEKPAGN